MSNMIDYASGPQNARPACLRRIVLGLVAIQLGGVLLVVWLWALLARFHQIELGHGRSAIELYTSPRWPHYRNWNQVVNLALVGWTLTCVAISSVTMLRRRAAIWAFIANVLLSLGSLVIWFLILISIGIDGGLFP